MTRRRSPPIPTTRTSYTRSGTGSCLRVRARTRSRPSTRWAMTARPGSPAPTTVACPGSARIIFDAGAAQNQTIGNTIYVRSDGTLVNAFNLIFSHKNTKTGVDDERLRGYNVAAQFSGDEGVSWSGATLVSKLIPTVVRTPGDGAPVRSADIL